MDRNPIVWFEIYVDDIGRAKSFYERVLQVSLSSLLDPTEEKDASLTMYAFPADMEQHGASGALVSVDGFPAGSNSTIVYFTCVCILKKNLMYVVSRRTAKTRYRIALHHAPMHEIEDLLVQLCSIALTTFICNIPQTTRNQHTLAFLGDKISM